MRQKPQLGLSCHPCPCNTSILGLKHRLANVNNTYHGEFCPKDTMIRDIPTKIRGVAVPVVPEVVSKVIHAIPTGSDVYVEDASWK